jgi:hypothetical protein
MVDTKLILVGLLVLVIVGCTCTNTGATETFRKLYKDNNFVYYAYDDEESLLSEKTHQYTFLPHRMNNVVGMSKRGCESAQYWECIHRSAGLKRGDEISEDVHKKCVKYSDDKCFFPERLGQSRTEPHNMYLNYV